MNWPFMVEEFMVMNKHPVPSKPGMINLTPAIQSIRLHLMIEELGELSRAMNEGDIVKFADSITDLLYVVIGTGAAAGLGPILDDLFEEVHKSNMTKTPSNIPGHRGALKGPGFQPPNLAYIISRYMGIPCEIPCCPGNLEGGPHSPTCPKFQ